MGSSVASFLVLGGGGASPPNVPTEKNCNLYARAPQNIFSGLKIHLHTYHQCSSLLLLMAWRYIYEYASELNVFFAFSHSKTTISFNIRLVLNYDTLSQKHIFSGLKFHLHI